MIAGNPRFGNSIRKLVCAYNFAKQFGINVIYHTGQSYLKGRAVVDGVTFLQGLPSTENYLASNFFYNKAFAGFAAQPITQYEVVRLLVDHFTFKLPPPSASADINKDLYIHIRSGDIYREKNTNPNYGQPPLAFYKKVLGLEKWERVFLVYEDDLSPVVAPLKKHLNAIGIPYEIQSRDLIADLEFLCRAENLVIGRGTFIFPVLCMSHRIGRVFAFEKPPFVGWGLSKRSLEAVVVLDRAGLYRDDIYKKWMNSDAQNRMILDYGEENLTLA